jgi:hypothetical protein
VAEVDAAAGIDRQQPDAGAAVEARISSWIFC